MNESVKKDIEKFYKKRKPITYNKNEIKEIAGISLRTYKYRIKELKQKYEGIPNLFEMKKNEWRVHQDLIHHFFRKTKKKKVTSVYQINWKTFITWVPGDNFSEDYHSHLIKKVIDAFPGGLFLPVIEKTEAGVNHVHMICDLDEVTIGGNKINKLLKDYWEWWECRIEVEPIEDIVKAVNYTLKDKMAVKSIIKNERLLTKILNRYENEKFN